MTKTSKDYFVNILKDWKVWAILSVLIIIVFTIPSLIVNNSFGDWANYKDTGAIGDTIGGLTSPIVNIVSAFLVFLALKAQIDANIDLKQDIHDSKIDKKIDDENRILIEMAKHSNNCVLEVTYPSAVETKGINAIKNILTVSLISQHKNTTNPPDYDLYAVINCVRLVQLTLQQMEQSKAPIETKIYITYMLRHSFLTHIYSAYSFATVKYKKRNSQNSEICDTCLIPHQLPDNFLTVFNWVNIELEAYFNVLPEIQKRKYMLELDYIELNSTIKTAMNTYKEKGKNIN